VNRRLATTLFVFLGALHARPAAADCLPAADLSGDTDVAREVAMALEKLGVVHGETDGACAPVEATVLRDENGIAVTVKDAHGRIEGRVVADAHTAAAWIESWASDDAQPLWSAAIAAPPKPEPVEEAAHVEPAPVIIASVTLAPPSEIDVIAEAPPRDLRRWIPSFTVRVGREVADDGSAWDGVGAAACVRVAGLCVGAAARYARNGGFTDTGGLTVFDRAATVFNATAAYPLRVARVEVSPEIAAGLGRTSTRRHEPAEACVNADGTLCTDVPLHIGDGARTDTTAARLGAGLGVALPLARWIWLDARVGAELAPGARTSPYHPPAPDTCDPSTDPNGCPGTDPLPVPSDDPLLDLPGEPAWTWGAAIGLRMELP
jgi:hypothetical protein